MPEPKPLLQYSSAGNASHWIWIAVLVGLVSLMFCWQGWKHHWQVMDDRVINIEEAHRLLTEGRAPRIGGFATTGGFNPPGLSYLLVPGLLSGDFRLVETLGASLCNLLTLVGIWMLTVAIADRRTAALAMALYGFSYLGLSFGSWLWPRAMPVTTVWMMYFLVRWVTRPSAWALAGAISVNVLGSYIFLEFLPAGLAFPIIWYYQRPPVRWGPCAVAALFSIILCYPYGEVQLERNFADLRMQLIKAETIDQDAVFNQYKDQLEAYDPQTKKVGEYFRVNPPEELSGTQQLLKKLFFRVYYFFDNLGGLFTYGMMPWGLIPMVIFLLPLIAWIFDRSAQALRHIPSKLYKGMGIIGFGAAIAANPWVAQFLMRRELERQELIKILALECLLFLAGAALFSLPSMLGLLANLAAPFSLSNAPPEKRQGLETFFIAFAPVWLVMAVLSSFTRYFMWLLSVEVIILALAISYLPLRQLPKFVLLSVAVIALACTALNPNIISRVKNWHDAGFAGQDLSQVLAMDAIADSAKLQPNKELRVGYHLWFSGYELVFSQFDEHYKLGAPLDQYLLIQHGLQNSTTPKIGYSAADDYRVVALDSQKSRFYRTKFTDRDQFELFRTYPGFEVWKRLAAAK